MDIEIAIRISYKYVTNKVITTRTNTTLLSSRTRTRLPSNLRPTTHECVHLVTRGNFRSRDKDGGHTIRFAISENPTLHGNFMALCFIEPELLPGIVILDHFCFCDLNLDPMTFIYELDPFRGDIPHVQNELSIRQGFRRLSYYRYTTYIRTYVQRDRQTPSKPRTTSFVGCQ